MATYAISGATGSIGTLLTKHLISQGHKVRGIARSEPAHLKLMEAVKSDLYSPMIGDVRDKERLLRAFDGVDVVLHTAAIKVIPLCAYNPLDSIKTNVIGTANVVEACLDRKVKKAVFISSDKATSPSTAYGAQKLCAEHLWLESNRYCGDSPGIFRAVRYGNVWGSAGSILHTFKTMAQRGEVTITDKRCTRFHFKLKDAVKLVLKGLDQEPGTLTVPKLPSYNVMDVAAVLAPKAEIKFIGLRANEKIHEAMISEDESPYIVDDSTDYTLKFNGPGVHPRFTYSSGGQKMMSRDMIRADYEEWPKENA